MNYLESSIAKNKFFLNQARTFNLTNKYSPNKRYLYNTKSCEKIINNQNTDKLKFSNKSKKKNKSIKISLSNSSLKYKDEDSFSGKQNNKKNKILKYSKNYLTSIINPTIHTNSSYSSLTNRKDQNNKLNLKIYSSPNFNKKINKNLINIRIINNNNHNNYNFDPLINRKTFNNISRVKTPIRTNSAEQYLKAYNTMTNSNIKHYNKNNYSIDKSERYETNTKNNNLLFSSDDILIKVKKLKKFNRMNNYLNYKNSPKKNSKNEIKEDNDAESIKKNKINEEILSDDFIEKCIIKIQSNFRRYIFQNKLYNNVNLYMTYIKAIFILNNVWNKIYKSYFMRKLKYILDYYNTYDKFEKELNEYKDKFNDFMEQIKKIQYKNLEINKKNVELTKQLKALKKREKKISEKKISKNANVNLLKRNKYNNSEAKKIQNYYTIQNQVNIIMNKPKNIIKKEVNINNKNEKSKKKYRNELKICKNKLNQRKMQLKKEQKKKTKTNQKW